MIIGKNILVIVAHSDDETIGMGGTIRKHVLAGDKVHVVAMTNGVGARELTNKQVVKKRQTSAIKASKILGFTWLKEYSFQDNAMDKYELLEVVKCVEKAKSKVSPEIVYTHSGADLNVDHRVVSNAVLTAFRPQPDELCREIRTFEVASATDYGHESITNRFIPNLFIDMSEYWLEKKKALACYSEEMKDYPHSRSIDALENLARLRGNQVGLLMAEAFQVLRKIEA